MEGQEPQTGLLLWDETSTATQEGGPLMRLYFQTAWAFILSGLCGWILYDVLKAIIDWQRLVNSTERTKQAKAARRLTWRDHSFALIAAVVAAMTIIFCGLVVGAW
jgi:p-aminobenzoyl-glutamate transporter AbgT